MGFMYYFAFIVIAVQNLCLAQISPFDDVPSQFPLNFESTVSFSSFPNPIVMSQPELTTASETSGTFGKPTYNFPGGNDFSQSVATAGTSAVSSFQTSQASTIPSSLETFVSTFTNAVHTSPKLSNLFDVSSTPIQSFENFLHQDAQALYKRLGISDPPSDSPHYLTGNFEVLTYPMLVGIDAKAMGKHLLAEGILNDTNAVSLALEFGKELETSAKRSVQNNDPKSKYRALMDGYVGFLKSQNLYKADKILDAGRYFRDEVTLAGKRFGISASNYASANV